VPELASLLASLAGILLLLTGLLPAALLLLAGFLSRVSLTRILGLLAGVLSGIAHSGISLVEYEPGITARAGNRLRRNEVPRRF